jgi:hypothetical protein
LPRQFRGRVSGLLLSFFPAFQLSHYGGVDERYARFVFPKHGRYPFNSSGFKASLHVFIPLAGRTSLALHRRFH